MPYLRQTEQGLMLFADGPNAPGPVYVDFVSGALAHRRRYGGGRRQMIGRAVGITSQTHPVVVDATAGLGRDAFILAHLGCQVTMIERSELVHALLADGLARAARTPDFILPALTLVHADALAWLAACTEAERPDVVYLDPMFPERKKSAAVKKEMQLLAAVLSDPAEDAVALLAMARRVAKKRVVVKRPRHAPTLDATKPTMTYLGKSTRFDVYC